MRFRNYLAEQYKKEDLINNENIPLPIIPIYILGFNLHDIDSSCIKVERNYIDLINKTIIKKKSDFVEKLSHNSFVVQVKKITDKYQTRLEKLLSVFEQSNFIDDKQIIKEYKYKPDLEELKIITEILHESGVNPAELREIEKEKEAWRSINALYQERDKKYKKELSEKDKTISEKDKTISEKDKIIEELKKKLNKKS